MHWPYVRQIEARVRADELVVEIFVYESGFGAKSIVYNIARFAQMVGMMIKTFRRTVEITDGRTVMIGRYVSGNLRPLLAHWVAVMCFHRYTCFSIADSVCCRHYFSNMEIFDCAEYNALLAIPYVEPSRALSSRGGKLVVISEE